MPSEVPQRLDEALRDLVLPVVEPLGFEFVKYPERMKDSATLGDWWKSPAGTWTPRSLRLGSRVFRFDFQGRHVSSP